jgi:hypothetical protein
MATVEEMTAWTAEEARAAVVAALPPGWQHRYDHEDGEWTAELIDPEGQVQYTSTYPEPRLVLLNAYGYLLARQPAGPRHPLWSRGAREDRRGPRKAGDLGLPGLGPTPDPADLDPADVSLVYTRRS